MFVSLAHSFKQQARLAITLAWVGGYTDIVALLACGTMTSHVSGITSTLGRDVFVGTWGLAVFAIFILGMFFLGAAVSGFCTELGRRRGWESIYVLPIIVEASLLGAFALMLEICGGHVAAATPARYWMIGFASAAMGLQNAAVTHISSGVVRTTHVTGVLTDLGSEAVQFLWWLRDAGRNVPPGSARGLLHGVYTHPPARRLALLAAIFAMFAMGAGLGTLAYTHAARWAMFPPVGFLIWIIYRDIALPIAEIEPSALMSAGTGMDLPTSLAIFHLRKDHDRRGRVHRLPNLLAWSARLPPATRIVILDLGEVTALDANAALELKAVLAQFATQRRELIISGVNADDFRRINLLGGNDLFDPENVCTDLELAIARGLDHWERNAASV